MLAMGLSYINVFRPQTLYFHETILEEIGDGWPDMSPMFKVHLLGSYAMAIYYSSGDKQYIPIPNNWELL